MNLSDIPFTFNIVWIFIALIVASVVYIFTTVPWYPRKEIDTKEGFFGSITGVSGQSDCSQMIPEFSKILKGLNTATIPAKDCTEDDKSNFNELQLIMNKMSCLKQDLSGANGTVDATRHQPFTSSHDIEQVSEVAATCLNQTISPRDMDIIFNKWIERSMYLLQKLIVRSGKSENDAQKLEILLSDAITSVYDISRERCIKVIQDVSSSSDPAPRTPEGLMELRQI